MKLLHKHLNLISLHLDKFSGKDDKGLQLMKILLDNILPDCCSEEVIEFFFETLDKLHNTDYKKS